MKLENLPPEIGAHLTTCMAVCGSEAEKDFIYWLVDSEGAPSEEERMRMLRSLITQVRYSEKRKFKADFRIATKSGCKIFIEWEGGIGTHRSAYRSYTGYVSHANKYNWLAANGFLVIRLCKQNRDTFWELWNDITTLCDEG
jgi:hypothetical protein